MQLEQLLAKQGKGQYNGGELRNLQNDKNQPQLNHIRIGPCWNNARRTTDALVLNASVSQKVYGPSSRPMRYKSRFLNWVEHLPISQVWKQNKRLTCVGLVSSLGQVTTPCEAR